MTLPPLLLPADMPNAGRPLASACHEQALTAPPPDVHALLDFEHSRLALYFDAQRAEACLRSQRDWPRLWRLACAPE